MGRIGCRCPAVASAIRASDVCFLIDCLCGPGTRKESTKRSLSLVIYLLLVVACVRPFLRLASVKEVSRLLDGEPIYSDVIATHFQQAGRNQGGQPAHQETRSRPNSSDLDVTETHHPPCCWSCLDPFQTVGCKIHQNHILGRGRKKANGRSLPPPHAHVERWVLLKGPIMFARPVIHLMTVRWMALQ